MKNYETSLCSLFLYSFVHSVVNALAVGFTLNTIHKIFQLHPLKAVAWAAPRENR